MTVAYMVNCTKCGTTFKVYGNSEPELCYGCETEAVTGDYTAAQLDAVIKIAKVDYNNVRLVGYKVVGQNIVFIVICPDSKNHSGVNWYVEYTVNQYNQVNNDGGQFGYNLAEWQAVY
jgi:hypothetical protein